MVNPYTFPPEIVTAHPGTVEACPVLTRVRAFVVSQGVRATLAHTFTHRETGKPRDLTPYLGTGSLASEGSDSSSSGNTSTVILRLQDLSVANNPNTNPVFQSEGIVIDATAGLVHIPLTKAMVNLAGLYQVGFAVLDDRCDPVLAQTALLSVERSGFGDVTNLQQGVLGPPSLGEIRMALRDNSPSENLLLQEREFGDDQIAMAITRPLDYFNSQPPPLPYFSTRTFPFREMWLRAITAQLFFTASSGYRRNTMPYQAGGVSVDDQNKETPYLQAYQLLDTEWKQFVLDKKMSINIQLCMGTLSSEYGNLNTNGLWGW